MKKQLLCTSAIALGVAAAAPASAQDWNLDWGGYYTSHIAYTSVGGSGIAPTADFDGIDVISEGEIIFSPSITLDNGLTFGVNVQMEAVNSGGGADGIDESYMTISSDTFGRLDLGGENSAGYRSMVAAPEVGSFAIHSQSVTGFAPLVAPFRQAGGSAYTEVAGNNDVQRITYFTPSFNGFTLGVSYAATGVGVGAVNNGPINRNAVALHDVFDIGVNYSQSFGTTDVNIGARWGTASTNTVGRSDPETWGIGATVSFNGISVGGHYAENDNGFALGAGDQEGWSFGVAYDAAGPWSFGATAFQGTVETGANDQEYTAYKIAGSRELGSGVSWDIFAVYAENQDIGGVVTADRDATIIGTSINLSF